LPVVTDTVVSIAGHACGYISGAELFHEMYGEHVTSICSFSPLCCL
jgi:hypothetical protein